MHQRFSIKLLVRLVYSPASNHERAVTRLADRIIWRQIVHRRFGESSFKES